MRTPAEQLADAAQLAATERTTVWLDQLTADGLITPQQRKRIAAEDGAPSLTRVLRRAELAGHDPRQLLVAAVADRPLDGARNTTNVLYARIADQHRFDPVGDTWAGWVPQVDNPEWGDYLAHLAAAADRRATELGRAVAEQAPGWAVEAFGPVPDHGDARDDWEQQAAVVAAYRELRNHTDDADALGSAPPSGQVEAYAAYRAAWRTLGWPEADRDELEMSDGQHRVRIRAWEREKAWAPRYVGNELAGICQAAAHQHQTAALRAAEADAATDLAEQARLRTEAQQAAALADLLDQQVGVLQALDDARAAHLAHTACTRAEAERSKAVLAERHAADAEPEQQVTAQDWLDAHRQALAEDERHREITDADIVEPASADLATAAGTASVAADAEPIVAVDDHDAAEQPDRAPPGDDVPVVGRDGVEPDLREVAAAEPAQVGEDTVRVPSPNEVSDAVERASRSLAEIRAREQLDAQAEAQHRAAELTRWHGDDQAVEQETLDDQADDHTAGYGYDPAGVDQFDDR